ncbi:hypothetical protein [Mycolicibacter hiberniae]|nr:hypothetical protein [Mycolicibacter hiberniae]MCV7085392.1 hypothetical protein [Mycolicibacter hiberniae]ORV71196.1 hypothetical protein AWC09_06635 [Mycolicibacter hiberniae]
MARRRGSSRAQPLPALRMPPRIQTGPDGYDYVVQSIAGARAVKIYRCPGCDHEIRCGVAHVVTWRADSSDSAGEDRRHWHTPCWANRDNRRPTRKWS